MALSVAMLIEIKHHVWQMQHGQLAVTATDRLGLSESDTTAIALNLGLLSSDYCILLLLLLSSTAHTRIKNFCV